ncbi:DUF5753 domain-containing protein [[Kitasatospora] papulosa]|uniref:DUF5753 domain-containing protein n=1 Tax=[Kitasatospora] papulosa TaxID=1464011 RepID=UPI0036B08BB0
MWRSGRGVVPGAVGGVKREHTPRRFDHCLELEARAARIQEFGASIVPGLLQTEACMRPLFRECNPEARAEVIDGCVAARLSRQDILHGDNPPDCWWILNEAAVRQAVGGPAVMYEQLAADLPLMPTERTTIHVVPFGAGVCALMTAHSSCSRSPTVYQEGAGSGRASTTGRPSCGNCETTNA